MERNVFEVFEKRAAKIKNKRLVFPEGAEPRVVAAVKKLIEKNMCSAIVLGPRKALEQAYAGTKNVVILDPQEDSGVRKIYAQKLYEIRRHKGLTEEAACSIISDVNYFACLMLHEGDADGMVSGAVTASADVIRPAFQIIKQKQNIALASSCFIMEVPKSKRKILGENGLMVLADCAVVVNPDAEGLNAIAESSIETAKHICGMTPKVAFLSYTSNTKTEDAEVLKVKKAAYRAVLQIRNEGDLQP